MARARAGIKHAGRHLGWIGPLVVLASLVAPAVVTSSTPAGALVTPSGYWLVASDGGVFSFGGAPFLGSLGGTKLNAPITGIAVFARCTVTH